MSGLQTISTKLEPEMAKYISENQYISEDQIEKAIQTLPKSYDSEIYSNKCDIVYNHFLNMAQSAGSSAYA